MARPEKPENSPDSVEANLNYLVDGGAKPMTVVADPGYDSTHTGTYEKRMVSIENARARTEDLDLDRQGFLFVEHKTEVTNFYDEDEVRRVYYPELEKLVKELTGASRVLMFDHTLRAEEHDTRIEKKVREPVQTVHNDYTEWSGPKRVRDLLPAAEAEELLKNRFAVIQVWRPIRLPVQTAPLAISDARSMDCDDLVPNERRYANRVGETYRVKYNPKHRWFYFPNMERNEALVFKCYDSEKDGRARFTAHSSFDDPSSPAGAPKRESIEARLLVFFPPS
jgi:hypothetical protein